MGHDRGNPHRALHRQTRQRDGGTHSNSILGFGRLPRMELKTANILKRLRSDKKTRQGVVHFVLPREIGKVEIASDVPEAIIRSAIDEIRKLARN